MNKIFEMNATVHNQIHWDTLHCCVCDFVWSHWKPSMSSNIFNFVLFNQNWREFRKWIPLIITLFDCCQFFLQLILQRLCFHYLHWNYMRSHNREREKKQKKLPTVKILCTMYNGNQFSRIFYQTKRSKWKQFAECNL